MSHFRAVVTLSLVLSWVAPAIAQDEAAVLPGAETGAETGYEMAEEVVPAVEIEGLGPRTLRRRMASSAPPLVLDVRTVQEYDAGHIPGALHVPHTEVRDRLDAVRAAGGGRSVVVYCMKGPRARVAEKALAAGGLTRIAHLNGGFIGWKKAGNRVDTIDPH